MKLNENSKWIVTTPFGQFKTEISGKRIKKKAGRLNLRKYARHNPRQRSLLNPTSTRQMIREGEKTKMYLRLMTYENFQGWKSYTNSESY